MFNSRLAAAGTGRQKMTHLIREDALERFEASNIDLIEELHVMMAAEHDAPAAEAQRQQPKSRLARWFSQTHRTNLAA
jgi:hypothetical protein